MYLDKYRICICVTTHNSFRIIFLLDKIVLLMSNYVYYLTLFSAGSLRTGTLRFKFVFCYEVCSIVNLIINFQLTCTNANAL